MSKIVQAVNAMISNPQLITKVIKHGNELFFLYKNTYKWSMTRDDDDVHILWYYPGSETLEGLASMSGSGWDPEIEMVTYRDSEIGTKEATASFTELYTLLKERLYDVNEVLDDIIAGGDSH